MQLLEDTQSVLLTQSCINIASEIYYFAKRLHRRLHRQKSNFLFCFVLFFVNVLKWRTSFHLNGFNSKHKTSSLDVDLYPCYYKTWENDASTNTTSSYKHRYWKERRIQQIGYNISINWNLIFFFIYSARGHWLFEINRTLPVNVNPTSDTTTSELTFQNYKTHAKLSFVVVSSSNAEWSDVCNCSSSS